MIASTAIVLLAILAAAHFVCGAIIFWQEFRSAFAELGAIALATAFVSAAAVQILAAWLIWPLSVWG